MKTIASKVIYKILFLESKPIYFTLLLIHLFSMFVVPILVFPKLMKSANEKLNEYSQNCPESILGYNSWEEIKKIRELQKRTGFTQIIVFLTIYKHNK